MDYHAKKMDDRRMRTGKCRLSYPHVFEVYSESGKYQVQLIIPKTDKETIALISALEKSAQEDGKAKMWNGKLPKKYSGPLHDGDIEQDTTERPEYEGCYYINAKSTRRPGVVDKDREIITDEFELYGGCYVRATLAFFPYENSGNAGVGCLLNNIQKLEEGDKFGSGVSDPEDDFDDDDDDDIGEGLPFDPLA